MSKTRGKDRKSAGSSQLESREIDVVSNTKHQSSHRKYWIFTLGKMGETDFIPWTPQAVIKILLSLNVEKYRFQLEEGKETGYLHYQGFFELKGKGKRLENIRSLTPKGIHLEPTRSVAAEAYCTKDDTRIEGPWIWPFEYKGKDLPARNQLYEWQNTILQEISGEPVDRRITWVWSDAGNTGKSRFVKYLKHHHDAQELGGTAKDAAFAVTNGGMREKPIYLFDLARTEGNTIDYSMLEQLSNGSLFSPKYESAAYIGPLPFIYVFANVPPRRAELSQDRWNIIEITEENNRVADVPKYTYGLPPAGDLDLRPPESLIESPRKLVRSVADAHILNWD